MSVHKLMVLSTFNGFFYTEFDETLDNLQFKSHYFYSNRQWPGGEAISTCAATANDRQRCQILIECQIVSKTTGIWRYLNRQIHLATTSACALDMFLLTNRNFLERFWSLV